MLQSIRKLAKRVALVSIRNSCAPDLADPKVEARVKDFAPIWLDDLLDKVELKYHPHELACESPMHHGERAVWTTFHPRRGQQFFYEGCREEFTKHRHDTHREAPIVENERGAHAPAAQVFGEEEIAQAVEDRLSLVRLSALRNVWMVTDDRIGSPANELPVAITPFGEGNGDALDPRVALHEQDVYFGARFSHRLLGAGMADPGVSAPGAFIDEGPELRF